MKSTIVHLIHISLFVLFPLFSVCAAGEAEPTLAIGSILETAENDSGLKNMRALRDDLRTAPRSTPYLEKIELRTETENFDLDKQKFSLRFSPKGWGETASAAQLRQVRNRSQELACEERFQKVLKDRYDLVVDYLETRLLIDIEAKLLVNLEDQIRVLRALGAGDGTLDVKRLIDAQDDQMTHQLKQVMLKDHLADLAHRIRQLTGCGDRFALRTTGLVMVSDIRSMVVDLPESEAASLHRHPALADWQMRVRLAEAAVRLEEAKNRDYFTFLDVSYDLDERDEIDEAVSLEVGLRLPFIHANRDDLSMRRGEWTAAKIEFAEAKRTWTEQRLSSYRQLMLSLAQYDLLTARKKDGGAAATVALYRQMDGVDPTQLLKIREAILKNDIRIQRTRFSVLRCYVDWLDVRGQLSARPLINYLSAAREGIL